MGRYNAIVIGGGPAGLLGARALAQGGCSVLLAEKESFPVDKPCGEGIMPTGVRDLQLLGAREEELFEAGRAFRGVEFVGPAGNIVGTDFPDGPGLGMRRTTLSLFLSRIASETPGLTLLEKTPAELVTGEPGQVRVGGELHQTGLILAADGLNSPIRRQNFSYYRAPGGRYGIRRHYRITPWNERIEVHFAGDLEAYVTPVGPQEVGIAFLWRQGRNKGRASGPANLHQSFLSEFPTLEARLKDVLPTSKAMATGPFRQYVANPVQNGVLLLGDAAGYIDAITGEGISLAAKQALLLKELLAPHLSKGHGPLTKAELKPYTQAWTQAFKRYRRLTNPLLYLSRHPRTATMALRALKKSPWLFQKLLKLNMGD